MQNVIDVMMYKMSFRKLSERRKKDITSENICDVSLFSASLFM